jgi:hypothetical protein
VKWSSDAATHLAATAPEMFPWHPPQAASESVVFLQAPPGPSGVPLPRSGRSPPPSA